VSELTLGVVADTHVPDRAAALNPGVLPVFRNAEVRAILHAGDVSTPDILEILGTVAPVHAVRGNMDVWRLRSLPLDASLEFGAVTVGLLHGHGSFLTYLGVRLWATLQGGLPNHFYLKRVRQALPESDVLVFGHLHQPLNIWDNERLLFNPGSANRQLQPDLPPSVGLLHIHPEGQVRSEIIFLRSLEKDAV
jgi:putative phosphoesterase